MNILLGQDVFGEKNTLLQKNFCSIAARIMTIVAVMEKMT